MTYRYNEIIVWMIPGLYFVLAFGTLISLADPNVFKPVFDIFNSIPSSALAPIVLFAVPFVSFLVGYILNYIASEIEYIAYKYKFPRPSRILLNNESKRYIINDLDSLKQELGIPLNRIVDNDLSNHFFTKVKQIIVKNDLDSYYFKSAFGRNLLCAQILLMIACIISLFLKCSLVFTIYVVLYEVLFLILLFNSWRRNNIVYVKYILLKYFQYEKIN